MRWTWWRNAHIIEHHLSAHPQVKTIGIPFGSQDRRGNSIPIALRLLTVAVFARVLVACAPGGTSGGWTSSSETSCKTGCCYLLTSLSLKSVALQSSIHAKLTKANKHTLKLCWFQIYTTCNENLLGGWDQNGTAVHGCFWLWSWYLLITAHIKEWGAHDIYAYHALNLKGVWLRPSRVN